MKAKTWRNLFSLVLAFALIFCMGTTAFAASVSIDNPDGNVYSAWQIMKAENKGTDENPAWIYTVNDEFKDFFNGYPYSLSADNEIILKDTEEVVKTDKRDENTNTTEAAALAAALERYAIANDIAPTATFTDSSKVSLDDGFYVIAETKSSAAEGTVASKPILLSVAGDDAVEIKPKADEVTLEKVIVEGSEEKKVNDANIGDSIDYKVTTKIPTYEANVDKETLKFTLTDNFSDGLTYNGDLAIEGFTEGVDYTATLNGQVLTIEFTPDAIYNNQGAAVVLTYSATLNENAKVDDKDGNPNTIVLEYTHNPNEKDSYKKLEDEVKTYTYGFKIHKIDANDETKALDGAEFQLKDSEGNVISFTFDKETNTYTVNPEGDTDTITTTATTPYPTIKGLDEGEYTLTETKAPDGYAKLAEDITVVITAEKDEDGNPTGIATFTVSGAGDASVALGNENDDCESAEGEVTENGNGKVDVHVEIKNLKGVSLPETGAMTALYCMIGGVIIALFGCVFFFGGKRKKAEE